MEKNINLKIPVEFKKINEYEVEDTRFVKVKIFLMHEGLNLNNSIFNEESIQDAIPSLANTPILGYIESNKDGEEDFSDHRIVVERKKDEIRLAYKGVAIGVIPESNNAHFEDKLCEDGITRKFLVVEGLVWTKWQEPLEILDRDTVKGQSMELADEYTGHFDEDGHFVFERFKFFGACILGEGITPAMTGACVEMNFSIGIIQEKLNQFNSFMSQSSNDEVDIEKNEEGGIKVEEEIKIDPIVEETTETENVVEETITEDVTEVNETITEATSDESENTDENAEDVAEPEVVEDFSALYQELKDQYEVLLQDFAAYKETHSTEDEKVNELVEYQTKKMAEERKVSEDAIFAKYETRIGNTIEFEDLKKTKSNFTLDALEKECVYIIGLHSETQTVTEKPESSLKFSVDKEQKTDAYEDLFDKYLSKNK